MKASEMKASEMKASEMREGQLVAASSILSAVRGRQWGRLKGKGKCCIRDMQLRKGHLQEDDVVRDS